MTKRATFTQADVTRAMKGAIAAGLPPDAFIVEIKDGVLRILPIAANGALDDVDDDVRRMEKAFGRR